MVNARRLVNAERRIPLGPSQAQCIFRATTSVTYAEGRSIDDALRAGADRARGFEPDFVPAYDQTLLKLK